MTAPKYRKIAVTIYKICNNLKRVFFNMKRKSVSNLSFHYVLL